ncbi:MAG: hypothetical protein ND895_28405 [Pyrinomonadaceae bacterium]|nr:hypothetical protein [Pyrinomonadaceae bacterium]
MRVPLFLLCLLIGISLAACATSQGGGARPKPANPNAESTELATRNSVPVIHVFVALCDNINQGIVPVSASLGNGDNPATNLYWGAAFGVKTFFKKNKNWELVAEFQHPQPAIMERLVFKHRTSDVILVADAYRGKEIRQTTLDFLEAASGKPGEEISIKRTTSPEKVSLAGSADVVAYIGHDGLMDFTLTTTPKKRDDLKRQAIILACASKQYFSSALKDTGASPLLWTTNLMAPEAYVLSAALDGWIKHETDEQIHLRAAQAYHSYQKCGLKSAMNLFATGW